MTDRSAVRFLLRRRSLWLFCYLLLTTCRPLSAAPMVFFGIDNDAGVGGPHPNADAAQGDFLAALGNQGLQDFENIGTNLMFSFSSGNVTAKVTPIGGTQIVGNAISGAFATSGTRFVYSSVSGPGQDFFRLDFDRPIAGFGFFATDLSDYFSPGTQPERPSAQVLLDQQSPLDIFGTIDVRTVKDANVIFFGVIDRMNPIRSALFTNPPGATNDAFGLDDLIVAATDVPEPRSMAVWLLLLGIGRFCFSITQRVRGTTSAFRARCTAY